MKRFIKTIFLIMLSFQAGAQVLTLDSCFHWLERNYPESEKQPVLDEKLALQLKQLNKTFYPQLNFEAKATLQSEVTRVDLDVPGMNPDIPYPDKDQYQASLKLTQTIYDGGITKTLKAIEQTNRRISGKEVEVTLHQLKKHITNTYFSIILLKQQKAQLRNTRESLNARFDKIRVLVQEGAALPADTNILKVEVVKLNNMIDQVERHRKTAFEVLSELTGRKVTPKRVLNVPQPEIEKAGDFDERPEMQLLNLRAEQLKQKKELEKRKYYPRAAAFGTTGYGRPGLNMLSDEFSEYWMVGASVSWELWNWKKGRDQARIADLNRDLLEKQKAGLRKSLTIEQLQKKAEIEDHPRNMENDKKVVELYDEIVKTFSNKLDNGDITSAEYVEQLNKQKNARLSFDLHQIREAKARVEYNLISGTPLKE